MAWLFDDEEEQQGMLSPQQQQQEQQINPQNMLWAAALQNIGNIAMNQAPQQNLGSVYSQAKNYNNNLRNNAAAQQRKQEQYEQQRASAQLADKYKQAQITKMEQEQAIASPWELKKTGKDSYGWINPQTQEVKPYDQSGTPEADLLNTISEDENRLESLISGSRKEFENSPAIKDYKAIKSKADTFAKSTKAAMEKFDKGKALNTAEQLDLVVSWYKMKDPTSTVTGGEVTSAADPGLADKANALINRIKAGGSLTKDQVQSFRSSGLASASALYDSAAKRAGDFMENVVNPNPYMQGRREQIVMPQYQQSPGWFVQGDQRFTNPLPGQSQQPSLTQTATPEDQGIVDFFQPR